MAGNKKIIEVCLSPALFKYHNLKDSIVVIVDILRASSSICAALDYGIKEIIPVGSLEEAKEFKEKGYIVAAERDGSVLDFADIGNSPYNFFKKELKGKSIAYSTTNGTHAILLGKEKHMLLIGSFLNLSALAKTLAGENKNVLIFCAGWKNRFSLEDTVFAGALAKKLIKTYNYKTICDSAIASIDLWNTAKKDLQSYAKKCAHRNRLKKLGLDDVIPYCFTLDQTTVVPVFKDGKIIKLIQ